MKIKYFGLEDEIGLDLTATLYDAELEPVLENWSLTEILPALYKSESIFSETGLEELDKGKYVILIEDSEGIHRGLEEINWTGTKETGIDDLDERLMTVEEKRQWRDALGVDGDKSVAIGGQLQKKSEAPYNNTIDTNNIFNE